MPSYNEEKFLGGAIDSLVDDYVREQAEILVVDGLSTDHTVAVAQRYRAQGYPVTVLTNEKRLQCYGLNQAIGVAEGDIIIGWMRTARIHRVMCRNWWHCWKRQGLPMWVG